MARPDIPVFVWGNGPALATGEAFQLTACFITIGNGVHVSYTIRPHEGVEKLHAVGAVTPCDGSCVRQSGQMEDFGKISNHVGYVTRPLFEAAMDFHLPFLHKAA